MGSGCCKINKYLRTRSDASKLRLPAVIAAKISTTFFGTNNSSNTNLDYNR